MGKGANIPDGRSWAVAGFLWLNAANVFAKCAVVWLESGVMKVLVIGSGGREHALVWKLAQSPHVAEMWCAPGNAGIVAETLGSGRKVTCMPIAADDLPGLLAFAKDKKPDLTVVGPDNPLALGVVDLFQANGLRIWGPNQKAAQFESSKVFSQEFMEKYGIPTARAGTFSDERDAKKFAGSLKGRCAVKADGLALGKGVLICHGEAEANRAIDEMLVGKVFGAAGARIVIQELLEGMEISLHALCDGKTAKLFPTAQDHKRALDGDMGLNTGGMGTYSPTPFLDEEGLAEVGRRILDPWLKGCAAEGIDYRGIIYPGVMLTADGPKVLEFNARFGDPETQVYLARLESDLVELLEASVDGILAKAELEWKPGAAVCVVMASGGYPGAYSKGAAIAGLTDAGKMQSIKVFHAGTALAGRDVVTNGGRVLGVTAWAADLPRARSAAYAAVEKIRFDGAQFRRDIAAKALGQEALSPGPTK
jgi:phosphoribosylamine--glycine ligase